LRFSEEYALLRLATIPRASRGRGGGSSLVADDVTRRILAIYEAGDLVTICGWCDRVNLDGEWLLTPRAALTAIDARYTLSHSICPECASARPRGALGEPQRAVDD
jgi:hypothetical protein